MDRPNKLNPKNGQGPDCMHTKFLRYRLLWQWHVKACEASSLLALYLDLMPCVDLNFWVISWTFFWDFNFGHVGEGVSCLWWYVGGIFSGTNVLVLSIEYVVLFLWCRRKSCLCLKVALYQYYLSKGTLYSSNSVFGCFSNGWSLCQVDQWGYLCISSRLGAFSFGQLSWS